MRIALIFHGFLITATSSYDFNRSSAQINDNVVNAIGRILRQHETAKRYNLFIHVAFSGGVGCDIDNTTNHLRKRNYFGDLVNELLRQFPRLTVVLSWQRAIPYRRNVHYDFILVDNFESLSFLYADLLDIGTLNLSDTVIYVAELSNPQHNDVLRMLQMLWQLSIINVAILLQRPAPLLDILLLTYIPFVNGNCHMQRPTVINQYNASTSQWTGKEFFPQKKLSNLYGCKLTCATWEDMPYLVQEHHANGSFKGFIGIEGKLLQFMADNLNFSIAMYMMNNYEITQSFNNTGLIFKEIFNGSADYALGAFHYKPNLIQTAPFSQTNYYFMSHIRLVTNLRNAYSTYEKLAFPFNAHVWLLIGCTFALSCCIICCATQMNPKWRAFIIGRTNSWPYYNLFSIAMGAPAAESAVPQRNFGRFLLSVWLLATLVMRSAYQSGMYRMLRDNTQRNPPQTIQSVVAMEYIITMIPENARFLASLPEVKHVRFLNTSELQAFPILAQQHVSGTPAAPPTAIITPYEYFGYFRKVNALSRRLHLVRERIFTQQLAIYVRRNSYLVDVLNEQIMKANSYGFLERWKREYVGDEYSDDGIILADNRMPAAAAVIATATATTTTMGTTNMQHDYASEAVKLNILSMNELAGIFWILMWLHLIAINIFMLECVWVFVQSHGTLRRLTGILRQAFRR